MAQTLLASSFGSDLSPSEAYAEKYCGESRMQWSADPQISESDTHLINCPKSQNSVYPSASRTA